MTWFYGSSCANNGKGSTVVVWSSNVVWRWMSMYLGLDTGMCRPYRIGGRIASSRGVQYLPLGVGLEAGAAGVRLPGGLVAEGEAGGGGAGRRGGARGGAGGRWEIGGGRAAGHPARRRGEGKGDRGHGG
eukprot:1177080-Prorocentrum_minimum.AAC.2